MRPDWAALLALGQGLRASQDLGAQHAIEFGFVHQPAGQHKVIDARAGLVGFLRDSRGVFVSDVRIEGGDDADRVLDARAQMIAVGRDPADTAIGQRDAAVAQVDEAVEQVAGDHGLEGVQLQLAGFGGKFGPTTGATKALALHQAKSSHPDRHGICREPHRGFCILRYAVDRCRQSSRSREGCRKSQKQMLLQDLSGGSHRNPHRRNEFAVAAFLNRLPDLFFELLERGLTPTLPMSESAFEMMRRCDAGLFVVTPEDCLRDENGECVVKPEVQAEIRAAYLFYNRRVLLLWEDSIPVPLDWQSFQRCIFAGGDLTWETGLQLTKELLQFKS